MIRWLTFKDLISKNRTGLIVKADPSNTEPSTTEPTPVVTPNKVVCPHCVSQSNNVTQGGNTNNLSYTPGSAAATPGKKPELDDIIAKFHKFPRIEKEEFSKLPKHEQESHLQHDALQHLSPEERGVLEMHVRKHSVNGIRRAEMDRGLTNYPDAYDPNKLHDDLTDRIMGLFGPKLKTGAQHGHLNRDEAEELLKQGKLKDKKGNPVKNMPALFYGSGTGAHEDFKDGKALTNWIREQANTYGMRAAEHDPVLGPMAKVKFLQNEAVKNHSKLEQKAQNELEDFQKEKGIESGKKINMDTPYSFSELEKIAHGDGYSFNRTYDSNGDIRSVSVMRDGEDKPSFEVDLKNGGKLSDVKEKLAKLLNPKETNEDHPVKQYMKHEQALSELTPKLESAQKDYDDAQEKLDLFTVDPQEHFQRISKHASSAGNQIEDMFAGLPKELKPKFNDVYTNFLDGVESLGLDDEDETEQSELSPAQINIAIQKLKKASQYMQMLPLPNDKRKGMVSFIQNVTSMIAEAESLKKKYQENPEQREKAIQDMQDKLEEHKDRLDSLQKERESIVDTMSNLGQHNDVSKYIELAKEKEERTKAKEKKIGEKKENVSQTSVSKTDSEGDEAGSNVDDQDYANWVKNEKEPISEDSPEYKEWVDENGADQIAYLTQDQRIKEFREWLKDKKIQEQKQDIPEEEIAKYVPHKLDTTNIDSLGEVSKNLIQYMNKKYSPKLVFGSKGKYSGVQRVASNIIANLVNNPIEQNGEQTTKGSSVLKQVLQEKPKDIDDKIWDKISKLNPEVLSMFSVLTSNYAPHPFSIDDIYENPNGMFTPLIQAIQPDIDPNNLTTAKISKILGTKKQFAPMFHALYHIGNEIIDNSYTSNSSQKEIFDKIKGLNEEQEPVKKKDDSIVYPGSSRRRLARKVDYLYGQHHGEVPAHPRLNHNYQDEDSGKKWLDKVEKHFNPGVEEESNEDNYEGLSPEEIEQIKKEKEADAEADKYLNANKSLVIYHRAEPVLTVRL